MAYYDNATDKIVGCKKNSLVWHHEDRHRQQFKNGTMSKLNTVSNYLLLLIIALILPDNWFYRTLFIILLITESLYLEIDAWFYAIKKKFYKK